MSRVAFSTLSALLFSALIATGIAPAAVINVDFDASAGLGSTFGLSGTYGGTAAAPDGGMTWNGLTIGAEVVDTTTYTSPVLVNSTNTSTGGVTVTLTHYRAYDTKDENNMLAGIAPALLNDYATGRLADTPSNHDPIGFTINGLTVGGNYNLYLYSQNGGFNSSTTAFTVNASTKTATNTAGNASTFVPDGNYVLFSGLVATGGSISGSVETVTTNGSAFNGFQLVEVPEPASSSLLAGTALLLVRRRR